MNQQCRWIAALAALLCALSVGSAYGVSNGEKVKINGLITGRNGDTLTVRTLESGNLVVVLTDDTKVEQPKGLLKIRKTEMGVTALMPGLKIQVDGVGDAQSRVVANTIKFSKDDLRQAEAIQAGLAPTQQAVETNQQNIQANKEGVAANKVERPPIAKRLLPTRNRSRPINRMSTSAFPTSRITTTRATQPCTSPAEALKSQRRIKTP